MTHERKTNIIDLDDEPNILHGSVKYLEDFRSLQSKQLKKRLDIFTKMAIDRYGSIENIKSDRGFPIESKYDITLLEELIKLETFVTIPYCENNNKTEISFFYTIGLWYYWGLPEIIILFDEPISKDMEFINVIINMIHDEIFFMYRDRIVNNTTNTIDRIDFDKEPNNITLTFDKFDVDFKLKKLQSEKYMKHKTPYMMWFYMYYMDAICDENQQPKLYPVYYLKLNKANFGQLCNKITDKLIENMMVMKKSNDSDDTDTSSVSDLE